VQALAREVGIGDECRNPFQSIIVRAIEIFYACDEALRIIDSYEAPEVPALPMEPHACVGHACTEAPRGILYQRYRLDEAGSIMEARIVPPTSQNQLSIEEDLREMATCSLDLAEDVLRDRCEQTIRNYDPCISCSAHFLKLTVQRS
jgi:coenzyme F420-reducing hydrogenase alpha subunit